MTMVKMQRYQPVESLNGSCDTKLQTLAIESENVDSISKDETSPEEKTLNTKDKETP